MIKNLYNRFFPVPQFLATPCFGLDISDESIKYAELVKEKRGIKVGHYGELKVPTGVIESGKIKDKKGIQSVLVSLKQKEGMRSVRVSLPEEQMYLFNLKLEKAGLASVREAIELSLEEYVPVPAQEVIFDYSVLSEDEQNLKLQVAAIPKNIIEEYLDIFKNAGIRALSFELEAQSIARCVIKKKDPSTYMIVDFGKKRTGIFIVSDGVVLFTSTFNVGGAMLTNTVQKELNISQEEAEQRKTKFGLKRDVENEKMYSVLLNSISVLRDELVKHLLYWHTHKDEEGRDRPKVKKIILCGGDANLIGLTDYLSISMKMEVELANVWLNILDTEKDIPELGQVDSLAFAPALGLALGNFEYD